MSFMKKLSSLWKSTDEDQPEIKVLDVSNLSAGNVIKFGLFDLSEISECTVELNKLKQSVFQNGTCFDFYSLKASPLLYRAISEDEIEIMRPLDLKVFLDSVGDEFNGFMDIEEDEFSVDNDGNETINSNEKSISINKEISWLPAEEYFLSTDEAETKFNSIVCRFSRLTSLDNKRVITITVEPNSGSTKIYESAILPAYIVEEMY